MLKDRRKCKNKGVSISEDLTLSNSKLVADAYKHEHCKSTWSVNGKCFGLLANKKIVRFRVGDNVNHVIRDGMKSLPAPGSNSGTNTLSTGHVTHTDTENMIVTEAEVHTESQHVTPTDTENVIVTEADIHTEGHVSEID